jgi:hypothetical protein
LSAFGFNRKIDNNGPQGGSNNGLVDNLTTSPKGFSKGVSLFFAYGLVDNLTTSPHLPLKQPIGHGLETDEKSREFVERIKGRLKKWE